MNSTFLNLNWLDLLKGLLVAVIGSILTAVYQALQAGTIAFTWLFWQPILMTGLTAGIAYILKNFLSNSQGEPLKSDPK